MYDCLFCKIIKGEIPCSKLYENENVLAFLDIAPVHKGHALVVPKKHYVNVFDVDENNFSEVAKAVKKLSFAVKKATNADGLTITSNNGESAGQLVMHLHTHIIPRFKGDGLELWPQGKYEENEMDEYRKKIEAFLNE
ncbi:HIT family protein [Candidatus Woesearchaeota archaeon B3_Woes]|nr:MAG: HIT family protein [Candidatus Woesearchaeota archaeon B3_Woes]